MTSGSTRLDDCSFILDSVIYCFDDRLEPCHYFVPLASKHLLKNESGAISVHIILETTP